MDVWAWCVLGMKVYEVPAGGSLHDVVGQLDSGISEDVFSSLANRPAWVTHYRAHMAQT